MTKTPYEVQAIIEQMGGRRIFAMAFSASMYCVSEGKTAVTFTIAPALKRAAKMAYVRVTLDPNDTYTVEFIAARAGKTTVVESFEGVYCDMLKPLVEKTTGLYLSL
jgi:hypothetical protein